MTHALTGAAALALMSTAAAHAGGIERTTQSAMVLYEPGNRIELSLGQVSPSLTGASAAPAPAQDIGNVASDFWLPSVALKADLSDRVALAFIYDQPYGANIQYEHDNLVLGGTTAKAHSTSLTALLKYRIDPSFSVFGGLRYTRAKGDIHLRGLAYGAVDGYDVSLERTGGLGYVLGAAYEKPEIALRVALTYNSAISHDMDTTESGPLMDPDGPGPLPALPLLDGTSTTEVKLPESWNLEWQTGIAEDTLLFGSVRYVKHSQFRVDSERLVAVTGNGLINLEDTTTWRIGLGRRFSDRVSGAISFAYEAPGDEFHSPLSPKTGYRALTLGGSYAITEAMTLSGGISYIQVGDAKLDTGPPGVERARFEDNDALALGLKLAVTF